MRKFVSGFTRLLSPKKNYVSILSLFHDIIWFIFTSKTKILSQIMNCCGTVISSVLRKIIQNGNHEYYHFLLKQYSQIYLILNNVIWDIRWEVLNKLHRRSLFVGENFRVWIDLLNWKRGYKGGRFQVDIIILEFVKKS